MIAKNNQNASHYFIEVEGRPRRAVGWRSIAASMSIVCRRVKPAARAGTAKGDNETPRAACVLSVSWQPAFCETKRNKPECATESPDRFDATHFTLHGLWPQPRRNAYCDVPPEMSLADKNGDWDQLRSQN
jgi:ribonuclease T2